MSSAGQVSTRGGDAGIAIPRRSGVSTPARRSRSRGSKRERPDPKPASSGELMTKIARRLPRSIHARLRLDRLCAGEVAAAPV